MMSLFQIPGNSIGGQNLVNFADFILESHSGRIPLLGVANSTGGWSFPVEACLRIHPSSMYWRLCIKVAEGTKDNVASVLQFGKLPYRIAALYQSYFSIRPNHTYPNVAECAVYRFHVSNKETPSSLGRLIADVFAIEAHWASSWSSEKTSFHPWLAKGVCL